MRVISRKTLVQFWESHPEAKSSLQVWLNEFARENWANSRQVKERFSSADTINAQRMVFNIHGNDFRLVVAISFVKQIAYIRFIGKHADYDRINAETV